MAPTFSDPTDSTPISSSDGPSFVPEDTPTSPGTEDFPDDFGDFGQPASDVDTGAASATVEDGQGATSSVAGDDPSSTTDPEGVIAENEGG